MQIILNDIGINIGLRKTAKRLREQIEDCILKDIKVSIDFNNVESVSSSFADELISKLYIKLGKDRFKEYIKLENVNEYNKIIIKSSIDDRARDIA